MTYNHPTIFRPWIYAWTVAGVYAGCRAFQTRPQALRSQRRDRRPGVEGLVLDTDDKADRDTWRGMDRSGRVR